VLAPCCGLPRDALAAAACFGFDDDDDHHHLDGAGDGDTAPRRAPRPRARSLDVGVLEDARGARPFLMMASRGLDARALRNLPRGLKRALGAGGIVLAGLREWAREDEPSFDYVADGEPARATFLAVQNIPRYGGGIPLAPDADPYDGRLDVVAFDGEGRAATLRFAAEVVLRRHTGDPRVRVRRVERVELPGQGVARMQLDGDAVEAELPATVRLHPHKLRILAPAVPAVAAGAATAPAAHSGAAA
jgi:diacylglycerol kinase (ATP)